jgi:hypothetical protein
MPEDTFLKNRTRKRQLHAQMKAGINNLLQVKLREARVSVLQSIGMLRCGQFRWETVA